MGNDFNKAVGKRLYSARKAKGYSRAKVGELVGLHETTVKRYEDGDIKSLDIERLKDFARVLGTPAADLLGWVANSDEHLELMLQLSEDSASGRTAAVEELRRTYGTEHGIHATYTCDDKAKLCILYYKALERRVALSLTDIIGRKGHASPARLLEGGAADPQHRGYRIGSLCGRFGRAPARWLSDR